MSSTPSVRRRDGVLLAAIHAATMAELAERGYSGVTFEGVAKRAETSKTVLYRRYPSRVRLVWDAILALEPTPQVPPRTGSLRQDLLEFFDQAAERFTRVGPSTFRGLVAESDPELLNLILDQVLATTGPALTAILAEARSRGELGPEELPDRVALLPITLLRHELLLSPNALERSVGEEVLDTIYLPLLAAHSRAS